MEWSAIKKEFYLLCRIILFVVIGLFIVKNFLLAPSVVWGESMQPTFFDQDKIIVNKVASIDRFDVIVFQAPDSDNYYVKRVIGVPGDHIEYKSNTLYLNGEAVEESYLINDDGPAKLGFQTGNFTLEELTGYSIVPENTYFVLGDNRGNSNDSRFFGFLNEEAIIGEVTFRFYPFNNFGRPE
ncbi:MULTISPECIES: signal peptidase I [Oceanobacillus]|uniref:Signal peptidase I n=1 Tax=Oceanobacillus aidingensis TaxID=645964 RepID=A0ABV9K4Y1_9BACI|nr:signal peptidase I [Oceanobacillus oncorhynchi]MDM8100586.1 signal peptidase I [Oceanobacillus oncorhynchi]